MERWKENKLKYIDKYNRENYRRFALKVSIKNDADIIEKLESKESINAYIRDLIRADIEKDR